MTRYANEMLGHKLASTYHLLIDGEPAGRIDTCFGQTFTRCTATVRIWSGPWFREGVESIETRNAGGGGYCRESAAVAHAVNHITSQVDPGSAGLEPGGGMNHIQDCAEAAGYSWIG